MSDSMTPWTVAHQALSPSNSPGKNMGVGQAKLKSAIVEFFAKITGTSETGIYHVFRVIISRVLRKSGACVFEHEDIVK